LYFKRKILNFSKVPIASSVLVTTAAHFHILSKVCKDLLSPISNHIKRRLKTFSVNLVLQTMTRDGPTDRRLYEQTWNRDKRYACKAIYMLRFKSFCYLMTLSLWRLYSADDRMITEYGAVCGMRIGKRNRNIKRKQAAVLFFFTINSE
jgi:hypothetical protein